MASRRTCKPSAAAKQLAIQHAIRNCLIHIARRNGAVRVSPVQLLHASSRAGVQQGRGHQIVAGSLRVEAALLHQQAGILVCCLEVSRWRQPPLMLLCRLEAEMAAMDVQRLQQQLQTSQSRLAEESLQRRQLQAELEQVAALSAALGLSSCLSRRLQAQMDQASECELCSCQVGHQAAAAEHSQLQAVLKQEQQDGLCCSASA